MTRSKCDKQLEKMTEERDHWRNKANEYKLEHDLLADQLRINSASLGAGGNEAYTIIKELRTTISELQTKLDHLTPHGIFNTPLAEDNVRFALILFSIANSGEGLNLDTLGIGLDVHQLANEDLRTSQEGFLGTMQHALPRMIQSLFLIPLPKDFGTNFYENHIEPYSNRTAGNLIDVFIDLSQATEDSDDWKDIRNLWRDTLYDDISTNPDYPYTRTAFVDEYGKFIKATLKNVDKQGMRLITDDNLRQKLS